MKLKSLLWLFPFISFIAGYYVTRTFFHQPDIVLPSLVGSHLYEAFATLSNHNLSPRLLNQKIDPDLPEGTVINQIPQAGHSVKQRQTVFLVLSKKPPITPAPNCIGLSQDALKKLIPSSPYKIKIYPVTSNYPYNQCIAQFPAAQKPIENGTLIVYVADSQTQPVIWPNFIGKSLPEVTEFLERYQIQPQISPDYTDHGYVIDQRPLAGSVVTLSEDQKPYVQLHVR